jgi:hypothetical protein
MKLTTHTLVTALEALKEKENQLRQEWIQSLTNADAKTSIELDVRKDAHSSARIELELALKLEEIEVELK